MNIILTGATGYVGEGTLLELLKVKKVEQVLSVSRKTTGIKHEKLEEYLVSDFMQLKEGDEHFKCYDAVFFLPFYPILRLIGLANNMREIALSQLALAKDGFEKFAVSPKDISLLAKKFEKSR